MSATVIIRGNVEQLKVAAKEAEAAMLAIQRRAGAVYDSVRVMPAMGGGGGAGAPGGPGGRGGPVVPGGPQAEASVLKITSLVAMLGSQIGLSTAQTRLFNIALSLVGMNSNLMVKGGLSRLKTGLGQVGGALAGLGPVGWVAIGVIAAIGATFAAVTYQVNKANKALEWNIKQSNDTIKSLKAIKGAKFGVLEVDKREADLSEQIEKAKKRIAYQERKIGEAKRSSQKDAIPARQQEIAALQQQLPIMERLLAIHQKTNAAEYAASTATANAEAYASDAYLESEQYLKDQITLNNQRIAAVQQAEATIRNETDNSAESVQALKDYEQERLGLAKANRDLQRKIDEPEKKRKGKVSDILTDLQKEADTLGMSSRQLALYTLGQLNATVAEKARAKALADLADKYEKQQEFEKKKTAAQEDASQKINDLIGEIAVLSGMTNKSGIEIIDMQKLVQAGLLTQDVANRIAALMKMRDEWEKFGDLKTEADKIKEDLLTPEEKLAAHYEKLKRMRAMNLLTQEQVAAAMSKAAEDMQEAEKSAQFEGVTDTYKRIAAAAARPTKDTAQAIAAKAVGQAQNKTEKNTGDSASILGQILTLMQQWQKGLPAGRFA